MSLINDMLNDLDDRRNKQQTNRASLDWMSGQRNNGKNNWQLPLVACIVVLIFLVIAYGVWNYQNVATLTAVDKLLAISVDEKKIGNEKVGGGVLAKTNMFQKTVPESHKVSALSSIENEADRADEGLPDQPKLTKSVQQEKPKTIAAVAKKITLDQPRRLSNIKSGTSTITTIRTAKPLTLSQRDREQYRRAEQLIRQQRLLEAEEQLQVFLQTNAQAPRSGELLVSLWLSQQQRNKASTLLASLRSYHPHNTRLLMLEARMALQNQQADKAVTLLMTEQPVLASHLDYYELLGLAARQNKQYQLSVEVYRGLLEFDSQRGDWWVGMGIALEFQQQASAARNAYQQALQSKTISSALRSYAKKKL